MSAGTRWAGRRGSLDLFLGVQLTSDLLPGYLGEVKKGKVSGFHNWIRFYLLEKQGLVDYYSHNYDGPVSTADGLLKTGTAPLQSMGQIPT